MTEVVMKKTGRATAAPAAGGEDVTIQKGNDLGKKDRGCC
jgi:hypothetical protein